MGSSIVKKASTLKACGIIVLAVCWDISAHLIAPAISYENPSPIFADRALFVVVITLSLLITFAALAIVFVRIQDTMTGSPTQKGLKFGIAFGGLWLLGIIEMSLVFDSSLVVELCSGIADASAIVLLGVLLGRSFATASPARAAKSHRLQMIVSASPFLFSWLAVRYLGYLGLGLESGCRSEPLATLIWTGVTGAWIGVMYLLLRPSPSSRWSPFTFPLVVFGIDWALFTFFVLIFVAGPTLAGLVARIVADLIAVGIGTAFTKRLNLLQEAQHA